MTTHWKKLTNPDYLGAYSLQPNEVRTVKILSVSNEFVPDSNGKKQECIVAKLSNEKPFILNKTNCKTIAKIFETPYIEEWKNKSIQIKAVKVKAFGEYVDALRVVPELPKLPELTPQHEKWNGAKQALKNGDVTIEQIKKNYELSKQNENELIK